MCLITINYLNFHVQKVYLKRDLLLDFYFIPLFSYLPLYVLTYCTIKEFNSCIVTISYIKKI